MAIAKLEKKAKTIVVEEDVVILELSVDEAKFIATVLDFVGGDPGSSRRRYQESISSALGEAGIPSGYPHDDIDREVPGIYFKKNMA